LYKKFYRSIENVLRRIDDARGAEPMLRETLREIVGCCSEEYGIESGRLYRERAGDYVLIESVGEYGDEIIGKTVPKGYPILRDMADRRLVMITPDTPGFDPDVEQQFTRLGYAAFLVGQNPSYLMSFGVRRRDGNAGDDLHFILETIRTAVQLKLRQSVMEDQLRQAQAIQQGLIPRRLPELPGFQLAAVSQPAEEVGGDVYDVQPIEDGVLGLLIADASGHGLPAALQARDVVTGLRMGIAGEHKISTIVQKLNRVIHQSGLTSRFVSLFYGELEESGTVSFVNAGHCPPLLFGNSGGVFEMQSNGPVLGPLAEVSYRRSFAGLHPGEILLLYTDGLIEHRCVDATDATDDGDETDETAEQYGLERLINLVNEHRDLSATDLCTAILDAVHAFGGDRPWEDDVTLMIVKRLPRELFRPKNTLGEVPRRDRSLRIKNVHRPG